jgi:hypothetical protein
MVVPGKDCEQGAHGEAESRGLGGECGREVGDQHEAQREVRPVQGHALEQTRMRCPGQCAGDTTA